MADFDSYFKSRLNEIVAGFSGKTLIFFRGFAAKQIRDVISHPNSLLNDDSLMRGEYLDLKVLNDKILTFANVIQQAEIPLVGLYEEFVALSPYWNLVRVDQIVIVENNMLSPWVPCCISHEAAMQLFDYLQDERECEKNSALDLLTHQYGDVRLLPNQKVLLLPVSPEDDTVTKIPFWSGEMISEEADPSVERVEIGSTQELEFCFDVTHGYCKPAMFLRSGDQLTQRLTAILIAAKQLGFYACTDVLERYQEKHEYDESQFLQVLKKYWGQEASFRLLSFYKDPDRTRETETISQGQIIAEIVDQCEKAQNGDACSNVFITAPTGSGKSILFQIPALYLSEKYDLVTIVVSPLIALMNDQVEQLENERGISIAAYINSSMSIEERSNVIAQIQAGKKSLIYLAPELLLTTHLQSFLGGRHVGLFVIDEAHTVTSWGRDFRSDYWFLGDFLKKTERDGLRFPVLCLTATAVYSGEDDVVNDTIHELGLEKTIIHLGNVKRTNIRFDIQQHDSSQVDGKVEDYKIQLTLERTREYIQRGEKVLTYFPYRTQVQTAYDQLNTNEHSEIRRYYGGLQTSERKMVERDYKSGEAKGLLCTKAFGMGIDVSDIKHVVHFAPTGTLADYVQEIGRAARNESIQGVAHIDYFPKDTRYISALNDISEMRQYQLREMLKKICAIQKAKKRRNLLIASETFEYLFKEKDVENRTKSGLLLLSKDLSYKYSFPVLIVRPKSMLSQNYINVPLEIEDDFRQKYGRYSKYQQGVVRWISASRDQHYFSDTTSFSTGNTYLVNMEAIWEDCYPDRPFAMFKKEFFEQIIKKGGKEYKFSPRVKVEIQYKVEYAEVEERTSQILNAITEIFQEYKNSKEKQFTKTQFEHALSDKLGEKVIPHDKVALLLDIFSETVNESVAYSQTRNKFRVLRAKKVKGSDETNYFVSNSYYVNLPRLFKQQLRQCAVKDGESTFFRFYSKIPNKPVEIMPLLRLLELLGLASYEIRGGEKAEVFIRINDPDKLERLAEGKQYTNQVLQNIRERHRNNVQLLEAFFTSDMNDEERWELIEQYFLGNESYVRQALGLRE